MRQLPPESCTQLMTITLLCLTQLPPQEAYHASPHTMPCGFNFCETLSVSNCSWMSRQEVLCNHFLRLSDESHLRWASRWHGKPCLAPTATQFFSLTLAWPTQNWRLNHYVLAKVNGDPPSDCLSLVYNTYCSIMYSTAFTCFWYWFVVVCVTVRH